jgi:tetratricopeptide (TPR) repeat protein
LKSVRATPPLPQVTSSSLRALQLYAEAANSEPVKARALLEQAVAIDSEFAMAYQKIWSLGYFQPWGLAAARKAVRYRDRLTERERLALDAQYYNAAYLFGQNRTLAVAALEKLAAMGDQEGMILLPEILNSMRQFARAESLDRINVAKLPHLPVVWQNWTHRLIELNRMDEATVVVDSGLKKFPQHWGLQWWKLRMLYYRGQLDDFEHALDSVSRIPDLTRRRDAMDMRVKMALMRGRLHEHDLLSAQARPVNNAADFNRAVESLDRAKRDMDRLFREGKDLSLAVRRVDELQQLDLPRDNPNSPYPPNQQALNIVTTFTSVNRPDIARRYLERYLGSLSDSMRTRADGSHFIRWAWHYIKLQENKPREAIQERLLADRGGDGSPINCPMCLYRDLGRAYDKLGDADSTILLFEKFVNEPSYWSLQTHPGDVHNYLRRLGELYEQKGNRQKAVEYYSRFVELWKNADPDLQPQVADIRARITRLRS